MAPKNKRVQNPAELEEKYKDIDESKLKRFEDLPLSAQTLKGLKESGYIELTDIQRHSIHLALKGNDILGAAKTGSGKTLAFLIPILEYLYRNQWTRLDQLGAIVITPTRELAYQIFETFRKVGRYHDFSAGLIIGGKDLTFEKKRMDQCNIVICTPGRLLQHMDENPLFDSLRTKILVLDEADRCLDMGFETEMNAIINNLPVERQTLLFSATQTRSVKDLARLSLKDPLYVSAHELSEHTTPDGLQQSYVIINLEDKLSMLWSFIVNHKKQKIIVFLSTCKQVRYIFTAFCRLRPGISLMELHGGMHQQKRMAAYDSFCSKQFVVLFATDIAARGLDFPAVDWVVQVDCPEDTNAYIHRAGRTARFQKHGESILVLLPSEEKMIDQLKNKKIPIDMITINPMKLMSPQRKLEAQLARDVSLKESAQRAFTAYIKSVFLMKDKSIFKIHELNTDAFARSLGLAIPPKIRFLKKNLKKEEDNLINKLEKNRVNIKNEKNKEGEEPHDDDENDSDGYIDKDEKNTKNNTDDEDHKHKDNSFGLMENFDDADDDDDILTIKRKNIDLDELFPDAIDDKEESEKSKNKKAVTKAAVAKKFLKKKIIPNKKINFDDEGEEIIDPSKARVSKIGREYENEETSGINIEVAKQILKEEDEFDKKRYREKMKERKKEAKRKLKAQKNKEKEEKLSDNDYESGEESEDSYQPDLSWLPDPDKIYGKQKDSDKEQEVVDDKSSESSMGDDSCEEESEEEQIHRPFKRKLVTQDDVRKKKKKITSNGTLEAAEELALQLLRN